MKRYILTVFAISCTAFWGCKPNMDKYELKPSKSNGSGQGGTADFSRYVAVGNSLTAGYSDGALYNEGQRNSYPALIAEQMKTVGGGNFTIPYIGTENGIAFNATTGAITNKFTLQYLTDCKGTTSLGPKPGGLASSSEVSTALAPKGMPFNNMGIPGAKSYHLGAAAFGLPPASGGNPFYFRIATAPGSSTVLGDALKMNPTFFTLWIGNNDVLGFATGGGEGDVITSAAQFGYGITQCLDSLTKHGAKGVIGNIPDVTAIPFCTTIPYNGLVLTRQGQVDSLNAFYAGYFPTSGIVFKLGQNPFVGNDGSGRRFLKSREYVLLTTPQDSLKCFGLGSLTPLRDRYFLDETEISQIRDATTTFNATISSLAVARNIAVVDMNANLTKIASADGIIFDGVKLTSTFVSGGTFSLDGVHLTPRGYAVVANYFIAAINSYYGANIPAVNVTQYRGVVFP